MGREKKSKGYTVLTSVSLLSLIAVVTFDAIFIFSSIQSEDGFDIILISQENFIAIAIVTIVELILSGELFLCCKMIHSED